MKHGLAEASATVRRCHTFGSGEAIRSLVRYEEDFVGLGDVDCVFQDRLSPQNVLEDDEVSFRGSQVRKRAGQRPSPTSPTLIPF